MASWIGSYKGWKAPWERPEPVSGNLPKANMVAGGDQLRCAWQCPNCGLREQDAGTRRNLDAQRWYTEDYAVKPDIVKEVTAKMKVQPAVDAFAARHNARMERWWGVGSAECTDAMTRSWRSSGGVLWMNPPFSMLQQVALKLHADEAHAIVTIPVWPWQPWYNDIMNMKVMSVKYPKASEIFETPGMICPPTRWDVEFVLVCGHVVQCKMGDKKSAGRRRRWRRKLLAAARAQ